ncbi:hypothetical protein HSX10_14665 [Winogradskyella undariae]|uniref:hypothetical protein n=1 Tax=Winogradskyella undariae TaxID=1285465 RepID=UPI00156AD6E3|nr:hypothetical protein [Winogradskyella undariae]NRR92813.1 hypothetical protein [Winogradskyella undariae]
MRYIYLLIVLCCFSCNNERTLFLPEIENTEITEVLDVSPAYLFYDETQPDSTLLNRKNLISTTNWLVNVDKRLTLEQAIPKITLMQNKKRNAKMHKNEAAKNYFTCNTTDISNLGFIEFTDVYFINESYNTYKVEQPLNEFGNKIIAEVNSLNDINLSIDSTTSDIKKTNLNQLVNAIYMLCESKEITDATLILNLSKGLTFQDYISIKSTLLNLKAEKTSISKKEFIF